MQVAMFSRSLTLFRIFGFAVRVHASWLIIALVVTWSLAAGFFPVRYPELPVSAHWWMGLAGTALLFGSIVVHEVVHALVARHYGMPMRGITLFVFGGIAEMEDEMPSAKSEFLMAAAGPAATIVIGFLFYAA
jgi:Zn-dependent protease